MTVIVGWDLGVHVGCGVIEAETGNYVASYQIDLDPNVFEILQYGKIGARLNRFRRVVQNRIVQIGGIDHMGYELAHRHYGTDQAHYHGAYAGLLQLLCGDAGRKLYEVAPSQAKKAATGHGAASKENMIAYMSKFAGLPVTEDSADALGVALAVRDLVRPKAVG